MNVEVQKGVYGLPQAGLLAQILLEERLKNHGYEQSKITRGFREHKGRPICFALMVDDFGVKYVGKEHARHLIDVLKENCEISEDWEGKKYVGLTFDWDYKKNVSIRLYQGMYTMPSYASSMAHHGERRINHINTQCRRMVLGNSLHRRQMVQQY